MKIYTKAGDTGETVLLGGKRVSKSDPRVAAYGAVDELNAELGVILAHTPHERVSAYLTPLQHTLFVLGADISAPLDVKSVKPIPRIEKKDYELLEQAIDAMEQALTPLTQFILPGGSLVASHLHKARTICRRAERETVILKEHEEINSEVITYLNRLSDFLFVLARYANHLAGEKETPWQH